MTVMLLSGDTTGGLPVLEGGAAGGQVVKPGQLQYGPLLLGGGTSAGWRELVGWRDLPEAEASDAPRPQAHGSYPGDVYGGSLAVTFTFMLRGSPEAKVAAVNTLERHLRMDGVDRVLAVDDGDGTWFRRARVIGRQLPQDRNFRHGPVQCSVQFLCADPRRYAIAARTAQVALPESSGGLEYPLVYPLEYGVVASGGATVWNDGSEATPPRLTFHGPLTDPVVTTSDWSLGFNIKLVAGEALDVDTAGGTALLNGSADRLYTIRNDAAPLERCLLQPGVTDLTLAATSGTGRVAIEFNDARM